MNPTGVFIEQILRIWKQEASNFGFIPYPRLERDFQKGRFVFSDDGFVYLGSPKSEYTPIHAVYIYPQKRNGSTNKVLELLKKLPQKGYRVRCHFGKSFWVKQGFREVAIKNNNSRKRNVFVLEGILNWGEKI